MNVSTKIITKPNPPNRKLQMRKPTINTAEQEQALRDQLHIEIENKTKLCSNASYDCTLQRLDGYEHCIRHILQDPKAPYKQCAYIVSANGRRCFQPAPKHENKKDTGLTNYCFEHSRLVQLNKTRTAVGKFKESETTESFLNNLSHHIKIDKTLKACDDQFEKDTDISSLTVDPFIDIDCATTNDKKRKILDYASDSSSDEEIVTIGNSWRGHELDNSDNESVDSQNEDLLKHAGIYTTEEATMITKEKLIKLQALYIEQFSRLQHVLKERRRKYIHALRKEKESCCSIYNQTKDTPKERHLYEKLKALNQYHRKNGAEAILHKKYLEKRARVTAGLVNKQPFQYKCIFTEGGVKCGEKTVPCCKFCKKHILEDKKQILFRTCGVDKSGVKCQDPVTNVFENSTCFLHIELPAQRNYTQKKNESDTEDDDELGNHSLRYDDDTSDIKDEYMSPAEIFQAIPSPSTSTASISSPAQTCPMDITEPTVSDNNNDVTVIFSVQTQPGLE